MIGMRHNYRLHNVLLKPFFKTFSTDINLILPNFKKISVNLEDNSTFNDIEDGLRKQKYMEKIQFRLWDHAVIAKSNELKTFFENNEMFFFRYDYNEWQVVSKENVPTEPNVRAKSFGPETEFKRISEIVHAHNTNKKLTEDELFKLSLSLFRLRNSHQEFSSLINNKHSLSELFEEYYKLKGDYARMSIERDKYLLAAEKRAKLLILLAGLVLVIELCLIYYGTFIVYTWDITEPMTYLLGCANIVLFLILRKRYGNQTAFEYHTDKFFSRITKKKNFNLNLFEANRLKIREIEEYLN
jgi:hypothetical protein